MTLEGKKFVPRKNSLEFCEIWKDGLKLWIINNLRNPDLN